MAKQSGAETTPGSTPFNRDLTAMVDLVLHFGSREFLIAGPKPERDGIVIGSVQRTGTYEPWIATVLERIVSRESRCIDIGANIGAISLLLGSLAEDGSVFAFEPVNELYEYLRSNVELNGFTNIFPQKFGISDSNRDAKIFIDRETAASFVPTDDGAAELGSNLETIKLRRLDDWAREREVRRIDLIKMDIEGAELAALNGAQEILRDQRPDLVIEFNPPTLRRAGAEPQTLFGRLREFYPHMFLIQRLDNTLVRLASYAQLRSLMLTSPGVEDLLCLAKGLDRVRELVIEDFLIPAYNASQILVGSSVLGGFLNRYPDGWTHGAEAVFLWEGRARQACVIELFTYFPDGSGHAKVCVACNDEVKTITLGHDRKEVLEFEAADGVNFLFIETDRTILAREIWHNEDPRTLGVNLQVDFRST